MSAKPKETSMAQKKKATAGKVTAKTTVTPKPKPKATKPSPPPKPTYDDVYAARLAMDAAHEEVAVAGRELTRDKTDFSDSARRQILVEKSGLKLVEARKAAQVATENFKKVKKAAQ